MRAGVIALVLATAVALPGCRGEPHPDRTTAEDEAEIRAVLERQKQAWNGGDIETFMQGYHRSPELVFTSGGKIRRGFDETLARYREKYVEGNAMGHLEFSEVELQPVGADGTVVLGRWKLTETPAAGEGVFTLVLTKVDGRWGIVHDHTSVLVP
jgi:ketosteroid isomerase-like protein